MKTDVYAEDAAKPPQHVIELHAQTELTDAEAESVAEAAFAEYAIIMMAREAQPHVVSQGSGVFERVPDTKVAADDDDPSDPRPHGSVVTGTRYTGLLDCPDCSKGLSSRGDDSFICPQVPARTTMVTAPGDIIACGRPR